MKIHEKYLKALEAYGDWLTVLDWTVKVGELFSRSYALRGNATFHFSA